MGYGIKLRNKPLTGVASDALLDEMLVAQSAEMQEVVTMVRQVALHPTTSVLLQGESGTGKDVIAHAIHELGSRAAYQFVPINCAAIPETLLESELFGVEAGAYTDAKVSREGYLLQANGGTFFLDEVGSMPLILQAKLLRFLETHSFRRVGGTKELHVDMRVISATNVDLQAAVALKAFRDDLFYRLKVITIYIPPLRERPADIIPLVERFLRLHTVDGSNPLKISNEALDLLLHYPWPGNIRQLRSAVQHGQILCDNQFIQPKDLPATVRMIGPNETQHLLDLQQQLHLPAEGLDMPRFLKSIENTFIQEALERCRGNQIRAAAILGISRDQLRYHLEKSSRHQSDKY